MDSSLVAPEGLYLASTSHFPPAYFPTTLGPPVIPTKLNTVSIFYPPKKEGGLGNLLGIASKDPVDVDSAEKESFHTSSVSTGFSKGVSGVGTPFLSRSMAGGKDGSVGPRPKSNIKSTSSSFVTRVQSLEGMGKVMGERARGGEEVRWTFWNLGRVWGWVELGGKAKVSFDEPGEVFHSLIGRLLH